MPGRWLLELLLLKLGRLHLHGRTVQERIIAHLWSSQIISLWTRSKQIFLLWPRTKVIIVWRSSARRKFKLDLIFSCWWCVLNSTTSFAAHHHFIALAHVFKLFLLGVFFLGVFLLEFHSLLFNLFFFSHILIFLTLDFLGFSGFCFLHLLFQLPLILVLLVQLAFRICLLPAKRTLVDWWL